MRRGMGQICGENRVGWSWELRGVGEEQEGDGPVSGTMADGCEGPAPPDDSGANARETGAAVRGPATGKGLDLMVAGEDGFVHEDDDFRTPLARITCPTCVDRIARSRTKKREEALGKGNGPKEMARHTRLIAEAYARLAEIEENLEIRTPPPHPE